jgi:hypothetical protein
MNLETQQKHFLEITEQMKTIMFAKGNDYANTDRLSNFKLAGNISGLSPELNCLSLIATKVARLGVLLNNDKTPNNESINDSLLDLANYTVLLTMILKEQQNKEVFKPLPYIEILGKPNTNTTYNYGS